MKRFSFAAAICSALAILPSCSRSTTIDIHLAGLKDGAELILADGADFDYEPVAEATVEKGSAVFKLDLSEPRAFRILPKGGYGGDVIGVSPKGTVKVEGNALLSESENERRMLTVTDMTVQGSEAHAQLVANIPDRNEMNRRFEAIQVKHQDIIGRMSVIKKGSEEWNAMMASDEWKAYERDDHDFTEMVKNSYETAVSNNSDNWLGPYFMLTLYTYLTTESDLPQYEAFSEKVKESFYGQLVAKQVVPMRTDQPMPDFSFTDHGTGMRMSLHDICKNSNYVLIDFWASWCAPCRKEIPNLKAMYELYHDKGFEIVSISADSDKDAWLEALAKENLQWPNDLDGKQGICKLYNVQFYPTVYLLDNNACVLASNDDIRGENLRTKLAELFAE